MAETITYRRHDLIFKSVVETEGIAEVAPAVTSANSTTIGAGAIKLDRCSFEWFMSYDEVVFVVEGVVRILVGDNYSEVHEGRAGDIIWIPANTQMKYEGDNALAFYALYPADWRDAAKS